MHDHGSANRGTQVDHAGAQSGTRTIAMARDQLSLTDAGAPGL